MGKGEALSQWDNWVARRHPLEKSQWHSQSWSSKEFSPCGCLLCSTICWSACGVCQSWWRSVLFRSETKVTLPDFSFNIQHMSCNLCWIRGAGNQRQVTELDGPHRIYMKLAIHVFFKEGKKAKPCFYGVRSVRIPGVFRTRLSHLCKKIYSHLDPSTSCVSSILLN